MLLPAILSLLLRAATAIVGCDGSVNVPEECLFDDNTLSYCECNLCQTYRQTEVYGGTPSNGPGISTSYMIPGVQSNHSLCLHHWTFFKVPTRSPGHDVAAGLRLIAPVARSSSRFRRETKLAHSEKVTWCSSPTKLQTIVPSLASAGFHVPLPHGV